MISTQFLNDCISGSEEAIQTLVRTHQRGVFQLALSILDSSAVTTEEAAAQAEVVTRDTFVAALDKLPRYHEDIPFTTWLYRIAITVSRRRARAWRIKRFFGRLARLVLRSQQSGYSLDQEAGQAGRSPSHLPAGSETALWQAVRALDDKLRLPVVLRYYHDFPVAEVARLLRVSEGTVHARLDTAREKVAELSIPGEE